MEAKIGASKGSRTLIPTLEASDNAVIPYSHGADDGNRTHVSGLGSPHSTIEPHPHIVKNNRKLERVKGIEPSYEVWKTPALPLCYTRKLEQVTGIEPVLRRWQRCGLPLHHTCMFSVSACRLSLVFLSVIRSQRMTVGTNKLQISWKIVIGIAINVMTG